MIARQFLRCIAAASLIASTGLTRAADNTTVTMYMKGSSAQPERGVGQLGEIETHFFRNNPEAKLRGVFHDVYPGIDMACIGDNYSTEYIFTLQPGADPNLISCFFQGTTLVSLLHSGSLQFRKDNIQIYVSQPVAYLQINQNQPAMRHLRSRATSDGHVTVVADEVVRETQQKLNGTAMNLVTGGGQPGGPMHDFFVSRYETTNEQLLYFLNDTEANQMNARGSHMFFDRHGSIWINPAMKMARDELFSLGNSRFTYNPAQPAGRRYDHIRDKENRPLYAAHPAMGLSWFGTVKYCNWLTLHSGRGSSALCYSEGTNTYDWAPVSATNWAKGSFTALERYEWLKLKGFRLSMTGTNTPLLAPNPFNEFYKAAAWNSFTNSAFGSGRDESDGTSANFDNSIFKTDVGTLPTGFFSQRNSDIVRDLTPSVNYYGVFDLSGNAAEWTTDANGNEASVTGGSWADPPMQVDTCYYLPRYFTAKSVGMRVTSSYMPDFDLRIHMLVTFYLVEDELPKMEIADAVLFPYTAPQTYPTSPPETPRLVPEGSSIVLSGNRSPTDYIIPGGIIYTQDVEPPFLPPGISSPPGGGSPPPFVPPIPHPFVPPGPPGPPSTNTTTTTTTTTTTLPPGPARNLYVRSSNPGSGVWVVLTPTDGLGNGSNYTPYDRIYSNGVAVTLTAPPMAGVNTFQRWQRNGVDYSTNLVIGFPMIADYTVTAIYMYVPTSITNPPPSPSGI